MLFETCSFLIMHYEELVSKFSLQYPEHVLLKKVKLVSSLEQKVGLDQEDHQFTELVSALAAHLESQLSAQGALLKKICKDISLNEHLDAISLKDNFNNDALYSHSLQHILNGFIVSQFQGILNKLVRETSQTIRDQLAVQMQLLLDSQTVNEPKSANKVPLVESVNNSTTSDSSFLTDVKVLSIETLPVTSSSIPEMSQNVPKPLLPASVDFVSQNVIQSAQVVESHETDVTKKPIPQGDASHETNVSEKQRAPTPDFQTASTSRDINTKEIDPSSIEFPSNTSLSNGTFLLT